MHGQRGFAKLVDAFHENHKKHSKKIIEFQIKRMTKYEKRGADPRVKYYLTPEMQEKYGVKVCVCELGITCLFIPYLSHHLRHLRQDPIRTPNAGTSAEDLKSLAQHIHGQKRDLPDSLTNSMKKHKNCDKKQIETQIKTMAKYEKRGADTRLNTA